MSCDNAKPIAAPATFAKRYYEVSRQEIAYLRFILESYDGLAFIRTIDKRRGLVEIAFPPERQVDAEALLAALVIETGMREALPPDVVPPL
jgi:hypothetical protein